MATLKKYDTYKDSGIEWIGEIPSHWDVKKTKFIGNTLAGGTPSTEKDEYWNGDIPWLQSGKVQNNIIVPTDVEKYITEIGLSKSATKMIASNSVLVALTGATCGNIGLLTFNSTANQSVVGIEFKKNYESKFNYYQYLSIREQILINKSGGAQGGVSEEVIKNLITVQAPPEEQTAISRYLDRKTAEIDELIADKKRLLQLYEEEKTAIINHAVTGQFYRTDAIHRVSESLKPLCDTPRKMKDSGIEWLGGIPEHWEVNKIGHCGKIVRGGSPRPTGDPRYFFGDYIHWITVKEVTNAVGKYVVGTDEYLTEEGSKNSRIIEPETLLLSNSGATLGVPKISKIRGCINDGSVAFPEIKSFLDRDYLYYFFVSHTDIYREQMAGNGQPNLNTEIIKSTFIPVPSTVEEQTAIVEFIESETQKVIAKKSKTEKLIELLTEYRTALISEVVTGKVKVI